MKTSEKVRSLQSAINQSRQPNGHVVLSQQDTQKIISFLCDLHEEIKILEDEVNPPTPPIYEGDNIHYLKF